MRRALLTAARAAVTLPAIGDAFMGGYYAGIIDTTVGNIIAADASQTGLRYALIVAPATLESASLQWRTPASGTAPAATSTRWDGLAATTAMAADAATYPAADYCAGLTPPADTASAWYLPAMDELEVIYRNLKPTTETNATTNRAANTFPGTSARRGENISSDPTNALYTTTVPAQTSVVAFQAGGAQALGVAGVAYWYWTSTWAIDSGGNNYAWQDRLSASSAGNQGENLVTGTARVRPVRRLAL